MERLRSFADNKTVVNLFTEFNHATLDAIAQVKTISNYQTKQGIKYYVKN